MIDDLVLVGFIHLHPLIRAFVPQLLFQMVDSLVLECLGFQQLIEFEIGYFQLFRDGVDPLLVLFYGDEAHLLLLDQPSYLRVQPV